MNESPGRDINLDALRTVDRGAKIVVFHCSSGNRTATHMAKLASAAAHCEAYVVEGGIEAWKRAGLPVARDHNQPIEIQRQVQIAAGSLVVLGILLGYGVGPEFHALSGVVGAGLVFAGLTGWCGLAKLDAVMPWNRCAFRTGVTQRVLT